MAAEERIVAAPVTAVHFEGEHERAWLVRAGEMIEPGPVAARDYEIMALFEGELEPVVAGVVTVAEGEEVRIRCALLVCRVAGPTQGGG